jgi:DNA-binding NarL/FixJ family response regulator
MPSILIIDDDAKQREVIRHLIEKMYPDAHIEEYDSVLSDTPDHISDIQDYDLVIMDTTVAGEDSVGWMKTVIGNYTDAPSFIILSSITDTQSATTTQLLISAIKQGATNFYFKKNLDMRHLVQEISDVIEKVKQSEAKLSSPAKIKALTSLASQDEIDDAATESSLAMEMTQGHKKWPFTMDTILEGKAHLGDYKIVSYLGEDNVASTFEARMPAIEQPVVVKLINRLRMSSKAIPESFVKKFTEITRHQYPNIIHMYGYEVIQDRMVVAMEFLHGGTLEDRLKRGPINEKTAILYFRQLLEGVAVLHELGLQLYQLTPGQLMFRDQWTLVITHLGIINDLHALSEITGEWALPYANTTPIYTTPESVQKQPIDQRSDIYLAGLIGYEMLVGEPVFSGGADQDILYAHAAEPMPSLPDLRDPMNRVLAGMLSKIPEKRTQSARLVLEQLNKIYPTE